jgi:hypothetical protein
MSACSRCGVETELYGSGVSVCVKCSDLWGAKRKTPLNTDQIRTTLVSRIIQATARVSEANHQFNDAVGQFPSGLPHPDGVQRIKNTSNELTAARKEMMTAHKRLNEFIERGVVPEDLKRSA